ncbi:MAG: putative secreted protein, partial [Myxococcaceae bacterium]|nr:putative secreted protein [Myxococcaceae bacterium]
LCTSGSTPLHAPDVLILQDASLSLTTSGMWTQMVTAVEQVTGMYEGQLAFGLSVFPAGGQLSCSAGALDIPFGLKNAAAIKAELDATSAGGLTPTPDSLRAAHTFMGARTAHNPAYIILLTDGEPDCTGASGNSDASADMVAEVKALFADHIHTFAVGPSNTSASALLDQVSRRTTSPAVK